VARDNLLANRLRNGSGHFNLRLGKGPLRVGDRTNDETLLRLPTPKPYCG